MAKARGLPDSFKLNVSSAVMGGKPVELGDYLDEVPPTPAPAPPPAVTAEEPAPALPLTPQNEPTAPEAEQAEKPKPRAITPAKSERQVAPVRAPAPTAPARLRTTVPRKQVNMNAETLNMVDQLMDYVQTYSVEKNLKASELFNAMVLSLYEAREHIDLARVQPRGRWGTPTAAALPIALKNAFQKAIKKYSEEADS